MIKTKINPELTKKYMKPHTGPYIKKPIGECPCGCGMMVVGTRNRKYASGACKTRMWIQRKAEKMAIKIARGMKCK